MGNIRKGVRGPVRLFHARLHLIKHNFIGRTCRWLVTGGALLALACVQPDLARSGASAQAVRVQLNVTNAALPVTVGVPLAESASVYDLSQLSVVDATGRAVPTQLRALARWRGQMSDGNRPVKWALVDFKPANAGPHFLTRAAQTTFAAISYGESSTGVRVANAKLELEVGKTGEALIRSLKLGGAESLRAPVNVQAAVPRRAIINKIVAPDTLIVTDATLLRAGDELRFEHTGTLKWDAVAGSARLVTADPTFPAGHIYRLDEGTPRQEDVTVGAATPGDLSAATALRFSHRAGSAMRDLTAERELARIRSIEGQTVRLATPLQQSHVGGEQLFVAGAPPETSAAVVERAEIEEANALRVVVKQQGYFKGLAGRAPPQLGFTARYTVYADQPFVRVQLRLVNRGVYGYGAGFTGQPPYAQHALLQNLAVVLPTLAASAGTSQVLTGAEAQARIAQRQSGASISAGAFEISVPEFVENYPKALQASTAGIRFDLLPDTGRAHIFDGARAKTTDFYLGRETIAARALTTGAGASLDPAYVATTGAARPAMVERRDWSQAFPKQPELNEAATRIERMFASAYAVEACEGAGAVPPMSIYEYRQAGQNGEQFGWRNFGDLAWGDGYANTHYDLPFLLLREYLRTGDARAFQLGAQMARYRADWGQHHADDFPNVERSLNFKGMAFYEKGDHGSYREPVPSHMWIEGLWLYWALTGDAAAREAAVAGSEAFARFNFTYENALGWGEPRWLGWPVLGLVAAYRYTGEQRYLDKARANVALLAQTEERYGRRGYFLTGAGEGTRMQPWAWSYSLLGVVEFWRETEDKRAADLIVRVADWLVGKGSANAPLKPGRVLADGKYLPSGAPYFWYQDRVVEENATAYAGMSLPILTAAARITGREDLWERARVIFRDYAFYRDLGEGKPVLPSARHVINFRSLLYPSSVTKVYGQMGLTVGDVLPELAGAIVGPRGAATRPFLPTPTPTPRMIERLPSAAAPIPTTPAPVTPAPSTTGLLNIALGKPATASSWRGWPNFVGVPRAANDGQLTVDGKVAGWHSEVNKNRLEWWQVDLGAAQRIAAVEIVFRADTDQEQTRRNFEVLGANNASFKNPVRLIGQGEAALPFGRTWQAAVGDPGLYRYVRVAKTRIEGDYNGDKYFNLAEVRVFVRAASPETRNSLNAPAPKR